MISAYHERINKDLILILWKKAGVFAENTDILRGPSTIEALDKFLYLCIKFQVSSTVLTSFRRESYGLQ